MTPEQQALQANANITIGNPNSPWSNPTKTEPTIPITRYTKPERNVAPTLTAPIGPAPVNETQIREETRKRMQTSIDAINANYANLISQEKVQGQDRAGQTRAMNARGGLMGSDFGVANQEKTTQYNKQQQQYLVDQQNAQVASIMQNIEDRANAEIQNRKQEALGKYERDLTAFNTAQTQAREDLKTLAQSGFDLSTLNPAQRAALLQQSGYDEQFGELIYNAQKPKPQQIDYKFEKLADGKGMFYGVDPLTGELKRQDVSVDLPPDWQIQIAPDGTVIGFDKNTGEARVMSGKGEFGKSDDSDLSKPLTLEEAKELGVPYGTTRGQVAGIVPGQEENFKQTSAALKEAESVRTLIEELMNHPGRKDATGGLRWLTALPGNARDFTAKFDQLIAQLQLQNISKLRGTGPITEREQEVLKRAATSLRRDIGEGAFLNELSRLYQSTGGIVDELKTKQSQYQSNSLFDEFEGGSEGTNPKAPLSQVGPKTLASTLVTKFPEGSVGGQCGGFVRKLASSFGLDYARLGDTLQSKTDAVKKHGTSLANAGTGSVIVTKENPTYGHVAFIVGRNTQGFVVAESNYKQSNKVSYGRVIPYNSPKIIGVINPTA